MSCGPAISGADAPHSSPAGAGRSKGHFPRRSHEAAVSSSVRGEALGVPRGGGSVDHRWEELERALHRHLRGSCDPARGCVRCAKIAQEVAERRRTGRSQAVRSRLEAIHRDPNHLLVVVKDDRNAVVGTMQLTLLPGLARGATTRLQIEGVRIAASAWGTGLGAALSRGHEAPSQRRLSCATSARIGSPPVIPVPAASHGLPPPSEHTRPAHRAVSWRCTLGRSSRSGIRGAY